MGKPRLIIIVRHAQSEGNKNREIHQSTPDHRVPLTAEGWQQAHEAGRKLRSLLRSTDTVHLFVSPYLRTRQTAEGMLSELTSDDPTPSPFPRHTIKVYEEPRLREQDFGNFQPDAEAMSRMWQERANYGHFFYRIPNGESAADAYDRVSGFNDSLWRRFEESDFASVCILVTHGLMSRVFLMKWYHFSVEYFEDLRNINHCEFVVMKKDLGTGKYVLQNQLRTWTEYKHERLARGSMSQTDPPTIPMRRKWGGCPEGCSHDQHNHTPKPAPRKPPVRQNTADLFNDDNEPMARTSPRIVSGSPLATTTTTTITTITGRADSDATVRLSTSTGTNITNEDDDAQGTARERTQDNDMGTAADPGSSSADNGPPARSNSISFSRISLAGQARMQRPSLVSLGGRDGGGSKSGAASVTSSSDGEAEDEGDNEEEEEEEEEQDTDTEPLTITQKHVKVPWPTTGEVQPRSLARALKGEFSYGTSTSTSTGTSVTAGLGLGLDDSGGGPVQTPSSPGRAMADALGDQSEDEKTDIEEREEKEWETTEMRKIVEEEKRERGVEESVY